VQTNHKKNLTTAILNGSSLENLWLSSPTWSNIWKNRLDKQKLLMVVRNSECGLLIDVVSAVFADTATMSSSTSWKTVYTIIIIAIVAFLVAVLIVIIIIIIFCRRRGQYHHHQRHPRHHHHHHHILFHGYQKGTRPLNWLPQNSSTVQLPNVNYWHACKSNAKCPWCRYVPNIQILITIVIV